jgi:hypothetical protein
MNAYDVVYIGFVTGHGGDALQMLTLAQGMRNAGLRPKIIVPDGPQAEGFAARCADAGIVCERSSLITAGMDGPKQSLPALTTERGFSGAAASKPAAQ